MKRIVSIVCIVSVVVFLITYFSPYKSNVIINSEMASAISQVLIKKYDKVDIVPFKTESMGIYWVSTIDYDKYLGDELVSCDYERRFIIQKKDGKVVLIDNNQGSFLRALIGSLGFNHVVVPDDDTAIELAKIIINQHFGISDWNDVNIRAESEKEYWIIIADDLLNQRSYKISIRKYDAKTKVEEG